MPLLVLNLKYDSLTKIRTPIELQHAIPKQPIRLVHYAISTTSPVDEPTLLVQLPFLNNFDINSNFDASDSIPLFIDPEFTIAAGIMDLEFNPARSIDETMEWKVYKSDGTLYESQDFQITLLFTYRRSDLM